MLNISHHRVNDQIRPQDYKSMKVLESREPGKVFLRLLGAFSLMSLGIMFLPWTQNINARGKVTTLKLDQRPQTIHSIIAGRIETWYVKEGDFVETGDTILYLTEIKDDYFDPQLLNRTQAQIQAKQQSVGSYEQKVAALANQIQALRTNQGLKLEQATNKLRQAQLKVTSDSIDLIAYQLNFQTAQTQFKRQEKLYADGLTSLTKLENQGLKQQKAQAEMISGENKLLSSRNGLINARVELNSIKAKFQDDIAKAQSNRYTALSDQYDAEATVNKLENQYQNYQVRTSFYYVTAPQRGFITQAIQSGLGETIKEGEPLVSIMPATYDLAVEMYVEPIDLPLLEKGQPIRIQFDGWPAIVFSGWPNTSYGTYGGKVFAIDNFISPNGKYRIMVAEDPNDHPWPEALRVGAGTNCMVLLKDVMIWYELWRQINGFPPDFYKLTAPETPLSK
ncbi:MAG: biotin/lipoyl-binding protein [Bacteroidota bacterium]